MDDETSAGPWFYVGEHDVFPEEFLRIVGFSGDRRKAFPGEHRDVLTADFWVGLQNPHRRGEVLEPFPYPTSKRSRARSR